MAHIVFVDAIDPTFWTMLRAVDVGHHVTFLNPSDTRWYSKSRTTIQAAERVLTKSVETVADTAAVAAVLAELHRLHPIDAVVNTVDATIEFTAEACHRLGVRFTSPEGVRNSRNKHLTRQQAENAGLGIVRQAVVHDPDQAWARAEEIGYPVIAKPVSGFGSLLTRKLDTPDELRAFVPTAIRSLSRLPHSLREIASRGLVIEEYIQGDVVSVELFASPTGWQPILVNGLAPAELNECVGLGTIVPAPLTVTEQEACSRVAEACCRACGLDFGIFHMELLLTAGGPLLLEVNPRMMGGVMSQAYQLATGHSFHDLVLAAYLGESVPALVPPSSTVVTRKLLAASPANIPTHVSPQHLAAHPFLNAFFNYNIVPGREVSTDDMLARCLVTAPTYQEAATKAEAVRQSFQEHLGFRLQQPLSITRRSAGRSSE